MAEALLAPGDRAFLATARTATLATIADDGKPRLVPICFVVAGAGTDVVVYTALDDKPKRTANPRDLARVRDILARPDVALLVQQWSEDWSELGWLRLAGRATILEPDDAPDEHAAAVAALRAKYPQYESHRIDERPIIRIGVTGVRIWGKLAGRDEATHDRIRF